MARHVLLVLIMVCAIAGTYFWWPRLIYTQLDDGLVEPDRLRDTLTIVAGRAETIRYEGRPVRTSEMRGLAIIVRGDTGAKYQDVVHARAIGLSR